MFLGWDAIRSMAGTKCSTWVRMAGMGCSLGIWEGIIHGSQRQPRSKVGAKKVKLGV